MKAFLLGLTLAAVCLTPAFSETNSSPAQTPPAHQGGDAPIVEPPAPVYPVQNEAELASGNSILSAIGGLGLVIVLMISGYFAVKKFAPRYFAKGSSERNLKIIETLSMGDKRSISMIQMGNSRFLVGNTPHQINLLMAVTNSVPFTADSEILSESPKEPAKKEAAIPFKRLLDVEKQRPVQSASHPLTEDVRTKMRRLREALDR